MQYQVLARKWRPQNFRELVGQQHVSRTLHNALESGRVAHAFLFSGPRGSGKTTTARILAKALNCHRAIPGEPCSQCPACLEIAAGNSMDVLEIDAASNRGIDEIRDLKEKARYNPARDRHKIFIVDEVHMLTPEAFNALLKTLEEPPPHVIFILATTEYHKIPATILSRCQQYNFKLIPYPLILERLRHIASTESIRITDGALEQVVFSSGGSMRDAMSALDQVIAFSGNAVRDEDVTALLGLVEPKVLGQTVRAVASSDLAAILGVVRDLVEAGQDLHNFCRRLSTQFRNLMVLKAGISDPALLGIPESLLADLRAQAELFSKEDLLRMFEAFQRIETAMKYATQVRFQLEMGLIELAHLPRLRPLEDLIAEFSAGTRGEAPAAARAAAPARPAAPAAPARDSRQLLREISATVGKESLEAMLQNFAGARLEGDAVVLDPGAANEFTRRQVGDSLAQIAEAAGRVLGRKVRASLGEDAPAALPGSSPPQAQTATATPPAGDLLEKVKREPVVKSFLDVFPGPVKAEKIDS